MTDAEQERRQRLIGIALMCGAVACFACMDSTAKYLNHHMDTVQVVWARYASAFLLALIFSNPLTRPGQITTRRPVLQIGRSAVLLVSTLLNFAALKYLQLDQALAIVFSTPFIVAVLSGPMLGEWVGWRRWTAICVGSIGVVVVTQPFSGGVHVAAFLSVASAACYAVYIIMTRILARTDSDETTLFYSNLVGAIFASCALPWVWSTPTNLLIAALMVLTGALGSTGHYLLIMGSRLAPASVVAPYIYTQLVWAVALGFVVFGDVPDRWTLAGAAIVIASGLYLFHRERRVRGEP